MKTMNLFTTILLTLTLGFFAGCGKKDEGKKDDGKAPAAGKVASCAMVKAGTCREYRDANLAAGTEGLKKLCETMGGTFGEVACPAEKMTATCKVPEHMDFYYDNYPIPAADLEKGCVANKGTWTAAPAK